MTIFWPADLKLPIKYGASSELSKGNRLITDMDYGPKKMRRRFTSLPIFSTVNVSYDDKHLEQFISFYDAVLKEGTIAFYANVLVGSSLELRRCQIIDETLKIDHSDFNKHDISCQIQIFGGALFGDGYGYVIGLYGQDFTDIPLYTIHYEINTHYPQITN